LWYGVKHPGHSGDTTPEEGAQHSGGTTPRHSGGTTPRHSGGTTPGMV